MSRQRAAFHHGMSLITQEGERKYLCAAERQRFLTALEGMSCAHSRTFCEMIFWSGCRPSEALALQGRQIDCETSSVIIRSLKKHGELKGRHFRTVPLPPDFVKRLVRVHQLGKADSAEKPLWTFSRTTGYARMKGLMQNAGITGSRASARGLRHSYGVHAVLSHVPEVRLQSWLGHADLATTGIYTDMAATEDQRLAARMWAA